MLMSKLYFTNKAKLKNYNITILFSSPFGGGWERG